MKISFLDLNTTVYFAIFYLTNENISYRLHLLGYCNYNHVDTGLLSPLECFTIK